MPVRGARRSHGQYEGEHEQDTTPALEGLPFHQGRGRHINRWFRYPVMMVPDRKTLKSESGGGKGQEEGNFPEGLRKSSTCLSIIMKPLRY